MVKKFNQEKALKKIEVPKKTKRTNAFQMIEFSNKTKQAKNKGRKVK
jgi:hypothetical protein